jgi:hypothetical protein
MRSVSDESANASTDRLATVVEAADILGITPDAVRSRLRRGTLKRSPERGEDGEVLVIMPAPKNSDQSGDQSETVSDRSADQSRNQSATDRDASPTVANDALVEALERQIEQLQDQLAESNRANAEHRRLLAAALERIPAIEAPEDSAPEATGASVQSSENSANGTGKDEAHVPSEQRSWLHRFFFGTETRT